MVIGRRVSVLAAAAALVALASAWTAAAPRENAFTVAALRRDGVIIPFATYDGRSWSSPWPPPGLDLIVPITVGRVPSRWWGAPGPQEHWTVVARAASPLRVTQAEWVDAYCMRQIGLKTDYQPAAPLPVGRVNPYPKDGLAIAPAHAVEPIEILRSDSVEVRDLLPVVHASFNAAERRTETRFGHPIARRSREGIRPIAEAVYAAGTSPRVYYVESVRSYRGLGQADCLGLAYGTGWFAADGGGTPRELIMTVDLVPCDRSGGSFMLPFGTVTLDGRRYWLAQFSSFAGERYVVLEIKQKMVEVVVSKSGGGC